MNSKHKSRAQITGIVQALLARDLLFVSTSRKIERIR
jgi:hypothetical protein